MADFAVTQFFEQGKSGWTETWYTSAAGHTQAAERWFAELSSPRIAMCGNNVKITALRVSDILIDRDSRLEGANLFAAQNPPADYPGLGVLVNIHSTPIYYRSQIFRGPPDDWILTDESGRPYPSATWRMKFDAFRARLVGHSWAIRVCDRGDLTNPASQIKTVADTGLGLLTITTTAAHNLTPGARIKIKGATGASAVGVWTKTPRGEYQVQDSTSATAFQIAEAVPPGYVYRGKGTVRKVIFRLAVIDDSTVREPRTRRAGRIFFVPAGRH